MPDSNAALAGDAPSDTARFTKCTMMRLSFTTTPDSAMIPISETAFRVMPSSRWPSTAPMTPNG